MKITEMKEQILDSFDRAVRDLSQAEYAAVLEETISALESRLDCMREELEGMEEGS